MSAFLELPRFPELISFSAVCGPEFNTDVVVVNSGAEFRNQNWEQARRRYDVAHAVRLPAQYNPLKAFFHAVGGRALGFRFKDWTDFQASSTEGRFLKLTSTTFQLLKRYRGATASYMGTSASSLLIATGSKTFVTQTGLSFTAGMRVRATYAVDQTIFMEGSVTSYNTGSGSLVLNVDTIGGSGTIASWEIDLANAVHYRLISKPIYPISVTGGTVSAVDYTTGIVLMTSGTPTDWEGEFDVPCRFETDRMEGEIIDKSAGEFVIGWKSIPIVEIRI